MNDRVFLSEMQVKFYYAILQKIRDDELEDFILTKHLNLTNEFNTAKQEYKKGKTVNTRNLLNQTNNE